MSTATFKDRTHVGQLLAAALPKYAGRNDVIVLGLPRGGVPVAYEVAKGLSAPLDVIVVRKLGVPGWEELAMGAVASGGVRVINDEVVRSAGIPQHAIEAAAAVQLKELRRREQAWRGGVGVPEIKGLSVILVDDGIATGATIRAAVLALRQQHPARIIIAVPTVASQSRDMLKPLVEEFISLIIPDDFQSVGQWYEEFSQTTDAEVTELLARGAHTNTTIATPAAP